MGHLACKIVKFNRSNSFLHKYPEITYINPFGRQQISYNYTQQQKIIQHNKVETIKDNTNYNQTPTNLENLICGKYDSETWLRNNPGPNGKTLSIRYIPYIYQENNFLHGLYVMALL